MQAWICVLNQKIYYKYDREVLQITFIILYNLTNMLDDKDFCIGWFLKKKTKLYHFWYHKYNYAISNSDFLPRVYFMLVAMDFYPSDIKYYL